MFVQFKHAQAVLKGGVLTEVQLRQPTPDQIPVEDLNDKD